MRNMFITNDILSEDKTKILEHASSFYQKLFKKKSTKSILECNRFLSNIDTPTISESLREKSEKCMEIEELTASLDSMHSNKSPGNDGLTMEFY